MGERPIRAYQKTWQLGSGVMARYRQGAFLQPPWTDPCTWRSPAHESRQLDLRPRESEEHMNGKAQGRWHPRYKYCDSLRGSSTPPSFFPHSCANLASSCHLDPPWPSLALQMLRMLDRCVPVAQCPGTKRPYRRHQRGNDPRIQVLTGSSNNEFLVPAPKKRVPLQLLSVGISA